MGGVVKNVAGALTGGLIGGAPEPEVRETRVIQQKANTPETNVSPRRSEQLVEAKRRASAQAKKVGRSKLRVDLADGGGQTRSGLSIGSSGPTG